MKLAFCVFKYFPYGGMQRDFLRMLEHARNRGHRVTAYTGDWQGPVPPGLSVVPVAVKGVANHRKHLNYYRELRRLLLTDPPQLVIGFNKMPGLDVYYAADLCLKERAAQRSPFYRLTPRYRLLEKFERAVFEPQAGVDVLLLTQAQGDAYRKQYGTPVARLHVLPPDISADRIMPAYDEAQRATARVELGLQRSDLFMLMLGSGFKIKGLDRALAAAAALPREVRERLVFWVVGQDSPAHFPRLAKRLGLDGRIRFTGGRDDVPRLLLAADLLVHPAYHENTGTVLLEAMACGLPVLVTDTCGYAEHVARADAGIVISSPFTQTALNAAMGTMLAPDAPRADWGRKGIAYVHAIDTSARFERALEVVERRAGGSR